MQIELYNVSPRLTKIENNKIVLVRVIENNKNEAIVEVNGERFKARVETDIPPSFFAYVERDESKNQIRLNLKIIEDLKNIESLKIERNEAEIVKDFLFSSSFPLNESNIFIALKLIKNNIPLNIANFELLRFAYRKYKKIPDFLIFLLQNGKIIDRDFIDIIFNIREILRRNSLSELRELKDIEPKEISFQKDNVLENLLIFLNEISENKLHFNVLQRKYKDDRVLILFRKEERDGKKRYYFDFSSNKIENFFVIIDIDEFCLDISVFLDDEILSEFNYELQNKKEEVKERLKNTFSEKKIDFNFCKYKGNSIFENIIFAENNKNSIRNLDIII
ncbi:MAG: hypothetical protein ACP5QT_04345 [Brevinematia bacterium]